MVFMSAKTRSALADLQRQNLEFEALIASIERSQARVEFDLAGNVLDANDNFLTTMGYALSEIKGRHHSLFVDPTYARSAEYADFWRRLNAGEFLADKYQRVGSGGRDVWIQGSYNPVFDASGKPYKVIKFANDVTQVEVERLRNEEIRRKAEDDNHVVSTLADSLQRLAAGDLTAKIAIDFGGRYQAIKDDFNAALESLLGVIVAVTNSTDAMASGSAEIASASQDLSKRTEQQAAGLEQTAAALDEITATVRRSAAGAIQAAKTTSAIKADAVRSGEVMSRAVVAMGAIERSSGEISQIIGVIDEIAFQTNLLALNAGVEAARAGDSGRGFAVVAQEVRALAQRSADAAKEIKSLIATSATQVTEGVALVGETGSALTGMVTKIGEIDSLIGEIAKSNQEQSTGIGEVNAAVNQMDQVTQQNAAMVEQATAAAASLSHEAQQLAQQVGHFRTGRETTARTQVSAVRPQAPPTRSRPRIVANGGSQTNWEEF
ncbi:PAS domain-containing methyl-accepting chemotaxis protein [Caulobacter sp. RHG1]|uniref:methyl-accepting chemotaxis protein n=1 Tax=Caulobacter sp. (strain RHG1) TaxID=2545762 RepID=UPI001553CC2B|nr:Methyl-accepting chemotaxis sensor/transducer protein [Caulobacter sp. RHG1]